MNPVTIQILYSGSIIAAERVVDELEMLREIQRIVKDPTTEGEVIRALTNDGELIFAERSMFPLRDGRPSRLDFGAYGWPYDGVTKAGRVETKFGPVNWEGGEPTLTCPRCRSQNWAMTGRHAARGTAPGGRGRMGDAGGSHWIECEDCHYQTAGVETQTRSA